MDIFKYIAAAKVIHDNKDLIIGVATLTAQVVYVGGLYLAKYISQCECHICKTNVKNGFEPVHK